MSIHDEIIDGIICDERTRETENTNAVLSLALATAEKERDEAQAEAERWKQVGRVNEHLFQDERSRAIQLRAALERIVQGYRNLLDMRICMDGRIYLTREEVGVALQEAETALLPAPKAESSSPALEHDLMHCRRERSALQIQVAEQQRAAVACDMYFRENCVPVNAARLATNKVLAGIPAALSPTPEPPDPNIEEQPAPIQLWAVIEHDGSVADSPDDGLLVDETKAVAEALCDPGSQTVMCFEPVAPASTPIPEHCCGAAGFGREWPGEPADSCPGCEYFKARREQKEKS